MATTLTYTGPTSFADSTAGNLSALLKQTSSGAAVSSVTISFTLGSGGSAQTCSGTTNSAGTATCTITAVNQTAGSSSVSASFAGNSNFLASSTGPVSVTITSGAVATKLTYTGPTQFTLGGSATVSAVLTETQNGSPVPGETISFKFTVAEASCGQVGCSGSPGGTATVALCSGTTNSSGTATCNVADVVEPTGAFGLAPFDLVASFTGTSAFLASTAAALVQFPSSVSSVGYEGPMILTDGTSVTLVAAPTDSVDNGDLESGSVTFTLGTGATAQTCTATVVGVYAKCLIRSVSQPVGIDTLTIAYSGTELDGHTYLPATITVNLTILLSSTPRTTLSYTGPTSLTNGHTATLTAVLRLATTESAISGQTITFTLEGEASGYTTSLPPPNQTCIGTTNASGIASCTISNVNQLIGRNMIGVTFAGNDSEQPSTATAFVEVAQ